MAEVEGINLITRIFLIIDQVNYRFKIKWTKMRRFMFIIFRLVAKSECWRCLAIPDASEDSVDLRLDPGNNET